MGCHRALLVLLLLLVPACAGAAQPANPHANARVKAILSYMTGLTKRTDKRVISGQFTMCGAGPTLPELQRAFDSTGKWPALAGMDYCIGHKGIDYTDVNACAMKWWDERGLVTISAHMDDPVRPEGGGLWDKPIDMSQLLTPGTDVYTRWMKELSTLADGLQELQDHGVVVFWRPFHEMNGRWFWWGGGDPATFQKVWQQMFDYFTTTRKLNNLIWVYSPNHGARTAAYYAGDHYVDLVGLDAYTDDVDPQHIHGYDEVAALPKPFGFTEFGPHGPSNPPGDYDYPRLIVGIKQYFPRACFFMSWNARWSIGGNNNGKELMNDPWIISRGDLPARLFTATP